MNPAGHESGNPEACSGRELPWLQETADDDVWGDWRVAFRDVVILDEANVQIDVYNLTSHGLSDAANREALKQKLRDAASY